MKIKLSGVAGDLQVIWLYDKDCKKRKDGLLKIIATFRLLSQNRLNFDYTCRDQSSREIKESKFMNQSQEIKSLTEKEWNEWYNKVYGYFFRRVDSRSDVEDLTAMTLNSFFLKTDVKNQQGLIWVIARNKLTDFIRAKQKNYAVSFENLPENLMSQTDVYSDTYQNRIEHLKECVKKNLKEQDYSIVELCAISDFSSEVVAAQLNLSPANVRQKLSRSLKKVREICRKVWQR